MLRFGKDIAITLTDKSVGYCVELKIVLERGVRRLHDHGLGKETAAELRDGSIQGFWIKAPPGVYIVQR